MKYQKKGVSFFSLLTFNNNINKYLIYFSFIIQYWKPDNLKKIRFVENEKKTRKKTRESNTEIG